MSRSADFLFNIVAGLKIKNVVMIYWAKIIWFLIKALISL